MALLELEKLTVGELKKLLEGMKDDAVVETDFENCHGEWESRPIRTVDVGENSIELNL